MNKSEFLKRLAALLHILQEDEVRDILDEYEQHIDMKMAGGMSEQDAIHDFGGVEELAAEILSAYHVRPDFKPKKENKVFGKVQDGSKKAFGSAGNAVKSAGTKTSSFMKHLWDSLKDICRSPILFIGGLRDKRKASKELKRQQKRNGDDSRMSVRERAGSVGSGCVDLCRRFVRFIIRICFGCIFVCTGFTEVCLVICAGILAVLMILGYPVIGITVSVLGAALSVFVVVYYSAKKMRRRAE